MLSGLISLASGGLSLYGDYAERRAASIAALSVDDATTFAGHITAAVGEYVSELHALSGEPSLIRLFEAAQPEHLAAAELKYVARFDRAFRLRLILPGTAAIDDSASPPMRFTALELLRRAETTQDTIPVELVLFGNAEQHIVVIARVFTPAGQLVGLLHLSVHPAVIATTLARLDGPECCIEVLQPLVESRTLALARRGGRGQQAVFSGVTVPVPGTRWLLGYWPAGDAVKAIEKRVDVPPWTALDPKAALAVLFGFGLSMGGLLFYSRASANPRAEFAAGDPPHDSPRAGESVVISDLPPGQSHAERSTAVLAPRTAGRAPTESRESADALADPSPKTGQGPAPSGMGGMMPGEEIFQGHGVEGVLGETFTPELLFDLGRAMAAEALDAGYDTIVTGRDEHASSDNVGEAAVAGLLEGGCNVIDLAETPTSLLMFASRFLNAGAALLVTRSDAGRNGNRLRFFVGDETPLRVEGARLRERIQAPDYRKGHGERQLLDIKPDYVSQITDDIPVALARPLRLVVDCRGVVMSALAPQVLRALGHDITVIPAAADCPIEQAGSERGPLDRLREHMLEHRADLGFSFDAGGDRLGVIDDEGHSVPMERLMPVFARSILARNPGQAVVYDAECGDSVRALIVGLGGRPVHCPPGLESLLLTMRYASAPLACGASGYIVFQDRWYGIADGLYAAARLIELVTTRPQPLGEVLHETPRAVSA